MQKLPFLRCIITFQFAQSIKKRRKLWTRIPIDTSILGRQPSEDNFVQLDTFTLGCRIITNLIKIINYNEYSLILSTDYFRIHASVSPQNIKSNRAQCPSDCERNDRLRITFFYG